MKTSTKRRALKAGVIVKKCRRGTVFTDPITGKSMYDGNRSRKSYRKEREIESFLRSRERGGVD